MFIGILRKSKAGRECLIYRHPKATQRCHVFLKIKDKDGRSVAVCARCREICRLLPKTGESERNLAKILVTDSTFGFNPLRLTHLPGCSRSKFRSVMEKLDSFAQSQSTAANQPAGSTPAVNDETQTHIEKETEAENQHAEDKGPDRGSIATRYPVHVCMEAAYPKLPVFVYKIADETNKCYKFVVVTGTGKGRDSNLLYYVICAGCVSLKQKAYRNGETHISLSSKKCDGSQLLSDPMTNHVPGCQPKDYDDVIKKSPLVTDIVKEKIVRGEGIDMYRYPHDSPFPKSQEPVKDYPVEIAMNARKPIRPQFIYRLPDCPQKCYRFETNTKSRYNKNFSTRCIVCRGVYQKERYLSLNVNSMFVPSRRTDGRRMLSDPVSGHLPLCKPHDYKESLKKTPLVTDTVKERIIKGKDISKYLPPRGTPFAAVTEANEAPEGDESIQVDSLAPTPRRKMKKRKRKDRIDSNRDDNDETTGRDESGSTAPILRATSPVACSDASTGGYLKEIEVVTIDSDSEQQDSSGGGEEAMDYDPESKNAIEGAREGRRVTGDSGSEDQLGGESGEQTPTKEAVARLVQDHSYQPEAAKVESNWMEFFRKRYHPNNQKKAPASNTPSREETKEFEIVTIDSDTEPEVDGQLGEEIEERNAGSQRNLLPAPTGVPNSSKAKKSTPASHLPTEKSVEDGDLSANQGNPAVSSNGTGDGIVPSIQIEDGLSTGEDPILKKHRKRSSVAVNLVDDTVVPPSPSSPHSYNEFLPPVDSVKRVRMDPPKKFKKKFDALIFNEEDVNVSVLDGGLLRVLFERKTLSSTPSRTSLLYELPLPSYVDSDSLRTTWREHTHTLLVRANIKLVID